jgi:hypothetical protein
MKKKLFILLIILLAECTMNNIISLEGVQINEYNGTRLDSITSFRENSISGPININNYKLLKIGIKLFSNFLTYR